METIVVPVVEFLDRQLVLREASDVARMLRHAHSPVLVMPALDCSD